MGRRYFIGVDLHKAVIQACVVDGTGEVVEEKRHRYSSLQEGLRVVEDLKRWRQGGRYAVEALGLNRWFVNACLKEGLDVVVADPVKLNLRMLGKKTDRRDAHEIARRLWMGDVDRSAKTYYPTDQEYGHRKVLRVRQKLVSVRQQLVNQIRSLLNAYRVDGMGLCLYTPASLARLRECSLPTPELELALGQLVQALEGVQSSIEALTEKIRECAKRDEEVSLVASLLPSVGPQTALTLVYELGDVRRFRNAQAVASYVGVVPKVANSADRSHHGSVTKRGNPHLRWVLGQWAVRLLSRDERVQRWAIPRLRRAHKNKVRVALARRLIVGVYIMLSRGEEFDLEKCLAA
jgi:transposase